ncbi:protein-disulfide reductase DsbD family protein [Henriciella pelagia]|jgi:thiol:disulfide interchange protein/DsbC/DsbD-like thiol-disulfide interchange protein|uniref:Thiol:disulfide interchange protein DsbD n=1 Tax=Henriciella pelagia TaxID=1977912 RepID=A0ABQ1JDF5_9PROT|nr:protein-disulfide reductase DsbD domain-containing protein [Henriciella pelagia]GGB63712.1 thiol:disulfide interchange protein DsbD [Henriciella pelagia]
MMKKLIQLFALCLATLSAAVPGVAEPVDGGHARVDFISEREVAIPGETVWLGFDFEMDPKWHIYWLNAGDAGIPPEMFWSDETTIDEAAIGEISWPRPELIPVVEGEIMDYGYSDRVVLPFPVTIPDDADDTIRFDGTLDYLICEDICIPERVELTLYLEVGDTQVPDMDGAERIADALAQVPPELDGEARLTQDGDTWVLSVTGDQIAGITGDARFFPETHDIVHSADQPHEFGEAGVRLTLTPDSDELPETLAGILAIHPAGGGDPIAVNIDAVPGDALEGTTGIAGASGSGRTESSGASGGINLVVMLSLALLGGLVLNLMPCVLPVLSIKAIGMVQAAAQGEKSHLREHGIWYTVGVLLSFAATAAAFLTLRAAGQFVSLGFQLQYPAVVAALALVMVLIGLWLLGVFHLGTSVQNVGSGLASKRGNSGAFFTGVLAAVVGAPCVGPFVGVALGAVLDKPWPIVMAVFLALGLGLALPFLVLSFVPGLHKALPKPGAWMERLKQAFAFPMFLTAAWLITVLGNHPAAGATAFGAVILAFGVWLMSVSGGKLKVPVLAAGAALSVFAIGWPVMAGFRDAPADTSVKSYASVTPEPWSNERVAELIAAGEGVFVDFTATWCATCQVNKRTTLTKPDVLDAMAQANVNFLVADFTRPNEEIAAELKKRGSPGIPLYLLYAPGESEPEILPTLLNPGMMKRKLGAFETAGLEDN